MRFRHIVAALSTATFALCATGLSSANAANEIPKFTAPVVDSANILSANVESVLNQSLESFRQNSGPQIAVLTVASTGNQSIEDYGIDVARSWGLGNKTRDDGVLLVIAFDDHKLRIETGSGIEGELTDIEAGRIIDGIIAPQLKAGDPDAAVREGTTALINELSAGIGTTVTAEVSGGSSTTSTGGNLLSGIITLIFILLSLVMFIIRGRKRGFGNVASNILFIAVTAIRSNSGGRGGGFSGGGGGGFSGGGASGSW
ncbi:MAG: TPM domain-containing protein [Actinomycetes bacterium]